VPAESICAAHSAVTETSAHPVSKSSLKERLHDPTPTQKRPCMGWAAAHWPKLAAAMSVGGQTRTSSLGAARPLPQWRAAWIASLQRFRNAAARSKPPAQRCGLILEHSPTCEAAARITKRLWRLLTALGGISGDGGGDEKIEGRCGSSRAIRVLSPNSLARPAVRTRVWTPTGRFCLWAV
jgi:hypothetical protein